MSEIEAPIVNITGDQVALGPLRREHLPLYLRWLNDFATTRMLEVQPRPMTLEQEAAWYDAAATSESDYHFTIYERVTGRPIGNCGLHRVDLRNRRAEVGILIGEPSARGKGYGAEAMRLLVDFAFTALGLHSVMLWTYEYNTPAQRAYAKVGFREMGRRREARWYNGRFWDEIAMDLLAAEFESPVLRALLAPEPPRT
jgi:RimJ/RimL family protein N-acetyltransferase